MINTVVVQENSFEKACKKIQEAKKENKAIIFTSKDDELNRKILEKQPIDILLLRQSGRKDFQKQRNSGFNQVLAKIAKKNKVSIGIELDEIINSKNEEKQEIIARIKQNIKICNKNKLKMAFVTLDAKNKRNSRDLKSLGSVLKMPTWMTRSL